MTAAHISEMGPFSKKLVIAYTEFTQLYISEKNTRAQNVSTRKPTFCHYLHCQKLDQLMKMPQQEWVD
jgi:hypothetical protein